MHDLCVPVVSCKLEAYLVDEKELHVIENILVRRPRDVQPSVDKRWPG